jgi:hypothetical protein
MEKIILAHYINVSNKSPENVAYIMNEVKAVLDKDHTEIIHFVYPVVNQETRVECINPKLVSEEDYLQAKNVLKKNQSIITRLLSEKMGI